MSRSNGQRPNGTTPPPASETTDLDRLEEQLRQVVAREIADQQSAAQADGRVLEQMDQRQVGRAVLQREREAHGREAMRLGELPLPAGEWEDLAERVLSRVFAPSPGLEQYLARADVLNIHVLGCRWVVLDLIDGAREWHPSPYATNQAVIDDAARLARRGGTVEKEFNYANPLLHLALTDGSRLTANAWVGQEPYITIRRHPLVDHDLNDLLALGMFDEEIASLLSAAVRARLNLLFAGGQGDGKTTLMRACSHEADPDERLVVLESEPELRLDKLADRHPHVVSIAELPGNMAGDGAVGLDRLTWHVKRMDPDRLIVGEVLGQEVVPMLEALTQGVTGSMATIHAISSEAVLPRLPVYACMGGRDWRSGDIYAMAALAIDLVIFVSRDKDNKRVISEIRYIDRYDHSSEQIETAIWYRRDPATGRATPADVVRVDVLDELLAHGYRPAHRNRGDGHR